MEVPHGFLSWVYSLSLVVSRCQSYPASTTDAYYIGEFHGSNKLGSQVNKGDIREKDVRNILFAIVAVDFVNPLLPITKNK